MAAICDSMIGEQNLFDTLLTLKGILRTSGVSINSYNSYMSLVGLIRNYEKKQLVLTFEKLGDVASKILGYLDEKVQMPSGPEEDILVEDWEKMYTAEVIKKVVSMGECC